MKIIDKLGDRVLGAFLPKLTASAGPCSGDPCYYVRCGSCYSKKCCPNAGCHLTCGSCGYATPAAAAC